jgi:hypothetical protein
VDVDANVVESHVPVVFEKYVGAASGAPGDRCIGSFWIVHVAISEPWNCAWMPGSCFRNSITLEGSAAMEPLGAGSDPVRVSTKELQASVAFFGGCQSSRAVMVGRHACVFDSGARR